jgi:hypothetical protein
MTLAAARPEFALLFDAAVDVAAKCYADMPTRVTIRCRHSPPVTLGVPPDWQAEQAGQATGSRLKSPDCCLDILSTLAQVGHRMTRQALLGALESVGKRWADGTTGAALAQLVEIGLLNNRQDQDPKGYGLASW